MLTFDEVCDAWVRKDWAMFARATEGQVLQLCGIKGDHVFLSWLTIRRMM